MKTQQQIMSEISEILTPYRKERSMTPSKVKKQILVLQSLALYLEGSPPEEEVIAQLARIERELEIYDNRFRYFEAPRDVKAKGGKAIKSYYDKLNGIADLKRKRLNLKYLLS